MLNEKAIFEVGEIIHVRKNWKFQNLSAREIIDSIEYKKEFKLKYPELSRIIEKDYEKTLNKLKMDINKILKEKENVFPKDVIVKFKTSKGGIVKFSAIQGTVYYEKKDVLQIIRILKKQLEVLETKK